jgi:hypothetical protein
MLSPFGISIVLGIFIATPVHELICADVNQFP